MTNKSRGRPRRDDSVTQIVQFRCTAAQRRELQRVADETGLRLSTVLRDAVADWTETRPKRGLLYYRK